jgi:hypothetical protein
VQTVGNGAGQSISYTEKQIGNRQLYVYNAISHALLATVTQQGKTVIYGYAKMYSNWPPELQDNCAGGTWLNESNLYVGMYLGRSESSFGVAVAYGQYCTMGTITLSNGYIESLEYHPSHHHSQLLQGYAVANTKPILCIVD